MDYLNYTIKTKRIKGKWTWQIVADTLNVKNKQRYESETQAIDSAIAFIHDQFFKPIFA